MTEEQMTDLREVAERKLELLEILQLTNGAGLAVMLKLEKLIKQAHERETALIQELFD